MELVNQTPVLLTVVTFKPRQLAEVAHKNQTKLVAENVADCLDAKACQRVSCYQIPISCQAIRYYLSLEHTHMN